jgi:hypothetical protein
MEALIMYTVTLIVHPCVVNADFIKLMKLEEEHKETNNKKLSYELDEGSALEL